MCSTWYGIKKSLKHSNLSDLSDLHDPNDLVVRAGVGLARSPDPKLPSCLVFRASRVRSIPSRCRHVNTKALLL